MARSYYAPNFEKFGRAYCLRLDCLYVRMLHIVITSECILDRPFIFVRIVWAEEYMN